MAVVVSVLPPLYLAVPVGRFTTLSLLNLRFACGVAGDGDMSPIWEVVARGKGRTEGLATLNNTLVRGMPYCCWVFVGRAHFSVSLPLLPLFNNFSLRNSDLDPY